MGTEVVRTTQDHINEAAVAGSAVRIVPKNSIAIVTRSGILERTVPIALVPFSTTLNQDMKAVHPHKEITPRWIAWTLRSLEKKILINCRKAGTTVASLSTDALMNLRIPIAPLAEQHRIVETIEDHLSRIDVANTQLLLTNHRCKQLTQRLVETQIKTASTRPLGELLQSPLIRTYLILKVADGV